MTIKIKDLPTSERPRERLIRYGASNLSNEELLVILFKSGTKNDSVKGLANHLLATVDSITGLKDKNYNQLIKIKGIGQAKACTVLAAIELGKRINADGSLNISAKFKGASDVYKYYQSILSDKKQEYFYVVYLDNQKRLIKDKLLFIGTINQSLIHPRDIFKEAYLVDSSAIVCVHNHPGDNVLPSKEDLKMTEQLSQIGNLFGIKVVDHIIVGKNSYYSFFENGDIN